MERLAKMAAFPAPPTCPLDGHELDIHFHGGVECPVCGAEYELGRGDELLPLKEHVEEASKTWPDTIPSDWKLAMADRTGNPQVDALIEQFLQTPQGEWTTDDQPIEALRDPELAHGMCQMVTEQFVAFAKSKGFKAYVTDTDMAEMGYKPQIEPFGEVGFDENDEMQHGFYPEHTIATIVMDDPAYPYGREFYIDFTASQYGYTDHPKVTSATNWKSKYDYRKRETVKHSCLTCSAFKPGPNAEGNGRGKCLMFDAAVEGDMTCTEWSDTWREKTSADAGYGQEPGGYSRIWDYPFLYHQPTGQLTWGTGNGNHEPLKDQMRARGETVHPDLTHGRWHPDDDTVKFYDPAYERMRPQERQTYEDMIRRNCPYRPSQTPQEPSSAPQTVEDDWAPQIGLGGL
jgi:hypothetical protein